MGLLSWFADGAGGFADFSQAYEFVFYLFLIVGKRVGLVSQSAADYEMLAVFVIAIDSVAKIWPTEREDFRRFWHGIKAYLSEMD